MLKQLLYTCFVLLLAGCSVQNVETNNEKISYSGIYPHLASYNNEGECGTGAVVPWAERLWVVTYGPHMPFGSSDKLYEIDSNLNRVTCKQSIGGTPANRMIHRESKKLFLGPYVIDSCRNVSTISYDVMPGRLTGNARHLTEPSGKIYYATMEEGFYEVDVNNLNVNRLFVDGNVVRKEGQTAQYSSLLPGCHGKGVYSGQGVLVYSNNGEDSPAALTDFDILAGSLSEWNGREWKIIRRNQFTEVTGPGGLEGNANPETDPIWATGWDSKSLLLGVRDNGAWSFYRLPKASHSYDGAHGWNTEWPRIRDIGTEEAPEYLMTMHGMFWHFPGSFSSKNSAGVRPRSAYLKVIGDFTRWNNQLVFGCDDAANKEFLNKRKVKGNIEGPGQSNSNLWFTLLDTPDLLGPNTAEGAVWISEEAKPGRPSEPFLFSGWPNRCAWIKNEGDQQISLKFEIDIQGNNTWNELNTIPVHAGETVFLPFSSREKGEWIRASTDRASKVTLHFSYSARDTRTALSDPLFTGLTGVNQSETSAGLLYGLGNNRRALGVLAGTATNDRFIKTGYYELDSLMQLKRKNDEETSRYIEEKFAIPKRAITIDDASVLVVDDKGRRWRLPMSDPAYNRLTENGLLRICREVVTERDLFSSCGTFYELPAENADGFAKIRPISSHHFRIADYASYRGLLILTGLDITMKTENSHIILSDDGKAAVWAGTIDDLWKLGKPVGEGGPWKESPVMAGKVSDPYLIGFYDQRSLILKHDLQENVTFDIEVDPVGNGPWLLYKTITVGPGETFRFTFPESFQARWIRFAANKTCRATAWLNYQ